MRAARLDDARPVLVHPAIEVLEIGEVGREEVLDDVGRDLLQVAELRDHAAEEDDDEVRPVLLDAEVRERDDLVLRVREPQVVRLTLVTMGRPASAFISSNSSPRAIKLP